MSRAMRVVCRGAKDESGQVATGLIICSVLALVAVTFWVMLPIGSAVNQKSATQNAADAAALAGAGTVIDHVVEDLATLPVGPFEPQTFSCGLGESEARRLATDNGSRVTSYCYDWRSDRATVDVASIAALSGGQHSKAKAVARTGVLWGACHFDDLPTSRPSPTPTPSSSASSSPSPSSSAPAEPVRLVCGGMTIDYDLQDGQLVLHDPQALRNMLKARLVE
ncbi:pilus assembly protein TadG-related protein [Flexivirga sp.]|uniref:pilus assembly protein TadG-related protein n=1 Tax=Flexivirga sp. TaxID=1962927 RepID=UPI003F80C97A